MAKAEERNKKTAWALPAFHRILLATDFSVRSAAAAPYARALAELYGAQLVVAHVTEAEAEPGSGKEGVAAGAPGDTAEQQMRGFIAENALDKISCQTVIGRGPVWESFATVVAGKHIDLIVLGTHGWSGVGKLLLGSVAQRIFSVAPCPVLSVSPRAQRTWKADGKPARILFATHFSEASLRALPYALSIAKRSQAELLLLHAPESPEANFAEVVQGCHQHLNALIPAAERSWCKSDTLVVAGEPDRVILESAERNSVDLVVMGAHAVEGSLATIQVPLSTAYRIVAHAPCPVLRVRS